MPAPTTIDGFIELGFKSGLLEREALQACQSTWSRSGLKPQSPKELADALIKEGVLTHFQAEKLIAGRWRGFLIADKYRLLERLGAGGMGQVFLCEHVKMGRKVALKILPVNQAEDQASLARFYREARAVARLDHPNIVRAHDIDHDDKLHFIVLEFVDGANLHDFVRRNGALKPERAAHYIRQAALGLQHAHEAGLVHRDIKPGNLLLDRQGTVKILDMGLARFFHEDSAAFIKEYEVGYIIGTGDYIAPEQIIDSRVDIRADIYSLGGTMYYLLTGKSPFQDGTNAQKIIWHQVRHPKSLRVLRPDVPEELMRVFEKIIAKEPDRRFQTPMELAAALVPFVTGPIAAPTLEEMPASVLSAVQRPLSQSMQPTGPPTPGTDREPGVIVLPGTPQPKPISPVPIRKKMPPSRG
ncbi:MAG: serine/threonine protein kinase [Planctomycetes bacterium]|nr:serine/threonine protein kinase [Planctomycetota bacterium]